jgi:cytochrome bd ubiquinol oxidase subunit I
MSTTRQTRQDDLASFRDVLFNPAQLAGFPHVLAACFLTAGSLVAGISLWQLMRGRASRASGAAGPGAAGGAETGIAERHALAFRHALKAGVIVTVAAAVIVVVTGDIQGKLFTTRYQPMKMAAAEALYHTSTPAPFSLLTIGSLN